MVEIGQTAGNNEAHVNLGLGVGLGEYNWGSSHTSNGVTTDQDYNVRPGGGSAIGGVIIMGMIVTAGAAAPSWRCSIKISYSIKQKI